MGAALVFHVLCGRNGGTGNELLDIPAVLRVTVQQMAASLPGLNSAFAGGRRGHHERGSAVAAGAGCAGRTVDLLRRAV